MPVFVSLNDRLNKIYKRTLIINLQLPMFTLSSYECNFKVRKTSTIADLQVHMMLIAT